MIRYFAGFLALCVIVLALWPWLFTVNGGGRKVCLSNVKQLVIANIIYQEDWDGRFPPSYLWMDTIRGYTNCEFIYHCDKVDANAGLYGYAFNVRLSGAKTPLNARETPLIFESVDLTRSAFGDPSRLPLPGRHKRNDYIGYADGHAKQVVSR